MNRDTFLKSLELQRISGSGTSWFSLAVTLMASDNQYLTYPVRGVIRFSEQGTDLGIRSAVFHRMDEDGRLGPPVVVRKPTFMFDGDMQ